MLGDDGKSYVFSTSYPDEVMLLNALQVASVRHNSSYDFIYDIILSTSCKPPQIEIDMAKLRCQICWKNMKLG